jgi:hypothetical protein
MFTHGSETLAVAKQGEYLLRLLEPLHVLSQRNDDKTVQTFLRNVPLPFSTAVPP